MTSTIQENPEVPEQPKRRQFSAEFKLKILDEIEINPDQVGLILRREGLYSSHLVQWKRWRIKMGEGGAKSLHNENAKLKPLLPEIEIIGLYVEAYSVFTNLRNRGGN